LFDKENGDFSFSNFTAALRVLNADELDFRFLHKYLHWNYLSGVTEGMQSHSTGIRNLDGDAYKAIKISFPQLPEQRRLVGILDEAFEGIATAKANAEKNLQNARALFQSHVQSVFAKQGKGWVEKTLGEIAQVKGGKRVPKGYKLLAERTDYPYLRVTEFTDFGTIDTSDLRYVSAEVHRAIKNYVIYSTDLYISIAGTIGKTGIIQEELDGANLTENACRLVFNSAVSNRFVYYFTVTPDFVEQAGLNTRTAAQSFRARGIEKILAASGLHQGTMKSKCDRQPSPLARPFRASLHGGYISRGVAPGCAWPAPFGAPASDARRFLAPKARLSPSPGQRPGSATPPYPKALKGRPNSIPGQRPGYAES